MSKVCFTIRLTRLVKEDKIAVRQISNRHQNDIEVFIIGNRMAFNNEKKQLKNFGCMSLNKMKIFDMKIIVVQCN